MIKSISLDSTATTTPLNDRSKAKTIAYWLATGIVVFCMTGGVFELLGASATVEGIGRLGYPAYIIPALGPPTLFSWIVTSIGKS